MTPEQARGNRSAPGALLAALCLAVATVVGGLLVMAAWPGDNRAPMAVDASASPSAEPSPARTTGQGPPSPVAVPPRPPPLADRTVVVDPGHNRDNGRFPAETSRLVDAGGFRKACNSTGTATAGGTSESSLNMALALEVRRRLEERGARVVLTRADDAGWGPCIDERAETANREGADLLLSLHADGAPASEHGFHVIVGGSPPATQALHARSLAAANALRSALVASGFTPSTYLGDDGLDVRTDLGTLNRAAVPAVMVEAGNLRHPGDAALLSSPDGRSRLATALVEGVSAMWVGPISSR